MRHWPSILDMKKNVGALFSGNSTQIAKFWELLGLVEERIPLIKAMIPVMESIAKWSEFLSSRGVTLSYIPTAIGELHHAAAAMATHPDDVASRQLGAYLVDSVNARSSWLDCHYVKLAAAVDPRTSAALNEEEVMDAITFFVTDEDNTDNFLVPHEPCTSRFPRPRRAGVAMLVPELPLRAA